MSRFTTHAQLYPFQAADTGLWTWALAQPLIWEVRDAAGTVTGTITVPTAFLTDLGTIPWWVRSIINPADPQCAKAFVLHDWCLVSWGTDRQIEAAGIMYQALRSLDVPRWRRIALVVGVILGIDRW